MSRVVYRRWITIFEVMIAIIIFGTWILVVMWTITSNIWWLYEVKNKDTAIMIAKEWMDIVYHVRDSNIERNGFWNCALIAAGEDDACGELFYDNIDKYFTVWITLTGTYQMNAIATTGDSSTAIRYHTWTLFSETLTWVTTTLTWFWYDHISEWWDDTWFKRWITMKPVSWYSDFTWSILEITSEVTYTRWENERSVVLQSFIGDIR